MEDLSVTLYSAVHTWHRPAAGYYETKSKCRHDHKGNHCGSASGDVSTTGYINVCVCACSASLYLVVVEVSVDWEPVCAQALQVSGSVSLWPPLNPHEGSITPGPQQLRGILFLLTTHVTSLGRHVNTLPLTQPIFIYVRHQHVFTGSTFYRYSHLICDLKWNLCFEVINKTWFTWLTYVKINFLRKALLYPLIVDCPTNFINRIWPITDKSDNIYYSYSILKCFEQSFYYESYQCVCIWQQYPPWHNIRFLSLMKCSPTSLLNNDQFHSMHHVFNPVTNLTWERWEIISSVGLQPEFDILPNKIKIILWQNFIVKTRNMICVCKGSK